MACVISKRLAISACEGCRGCKDGVTCATVDERISMPPYIVKS